MAILKQVQDSSAGRPVRFVVIERGVEIGFIEKLPPAPQETHPWKAFRGIGHKAEFLGVSYARNGKEIAMEAVVQNRKLKG